MNYANIREEELKNRIAHDFFDRFDTTEIINNIDFAVKYEKIGLFGDQYLLWAEAKTGNSDLCASFVQLILTIGQSGTVGNRLPPPFLGAFDAQKIAFIPYIDIADIFSINDFNWKITPSNHESKEFRLLYNRTQKIIQERMYCYEFEKDEIELSHFIHNNLQAGHTGGKIQITKNNFIHIYLRWLEEIKPHINFNWEGGKKAGVLDCDFYRADLFVDDKNTESIDDDTPVTDKLSVIFRDGKYWIVTEVWGNEAEMAFGFHHGGRECYTAFWKKYKRPPIEEYWSYIVDRRDLLVPQDIRERRGSFFTPKIWVELSQRYIADTLGDDWQDEYTVWDCASGTGNLLAGLTNKYNIWASTLDKADVDVMHERIESGANLLHNHIFQFDFLNDDFSKLPQGLLNIINDEQKRKKLVIYINPPYAEADNRKGEGREGVAISAIHKKYSNLMGYTKREMYIQFLTRIYCEIPTCVLADFSTLKNLQAPKFQDFRKFFRAKLAKIFLVPADTFDNVKGDFPISFKIWDTAIKEDFKHILADVYNGNGEFTGTKNLWAYDNEKVINDWTQTFIDKDNESIATIIGVGNDFQNQRLARIEKPHRPWNHQYQWQITKNNLIESSIYLTVRTIIPADWLNDRDQFLYPNDGWKTDPEFQTDCLTYTLFNNNIQSVHGTNHWIPFTEVEVNASDKFASNFMTRFINGKNVRVGATRPNAPTPDLFASSGGHVENEKKSPPQTGRPLIFSSEAKAVFTAGRDLWRHYHAQPQCNVNASFYDIREHFQGRNEKGKMNTRSNNQTYNELMACLRTTMKTLTRKIEPKVYEYGFLKE